MNEEKNLAEVTAFDKTNFGERVRIRRTLLQMTQEELAEKLEVSVETVKNIENAKRGTSIEKLIALAGILQTTPDYLLGFNVSAPSAGPAADKLEGLLNYLRHCSPAEIEELEPFIVMLVNTMRKRKS